VREKRKGDINTSCLQRRKLQHSSPTGADEEADLLLHSAMPQYTSANTLVGKVHLQHAKAVVFDCAVGKDFDFGHIELGPAGQKSVSERGVRGERGELQNNNDNDKKQFLFTFHTK
jgi:hypothetical protein